MVNFTTAIISQELSTRRKSIEVNSNAKAKQLEQTQIETAPLVKEADAKYTAKDYSAARELFSLAVAQYPNDYHTHDLLARSMYREKTKNKDYDKIIAESKKAIALAPDSNSKADCYGFLAQVYRKLAMNNLFNTNNKIDYTALAQQCDYMEQKLRQMK